MASDVRSAVVDRLRSGAKHVLVVLHDGERVVEVVQQFAPPLVLGRAAEADGVVLEAVLLDQQQVGAGALQASGQR